MGLLTTSAGGIVLRYERDEAFIVIVERGKNVPPKWAPLLRQLPKGECSLGETLQQTALREVLEETGFDCQIVGKAGLAQWSYERDNLSWDETVHYFFMFPKAIAAQEHDDEFDRVLWVRIDHAVQFLSYPEERELIARVLSGNLVPPSTNAYHE